MELSLIVPVYNEEGNIAPLLQSIYSSLENIKYELILIDDGSTDATASLICQNKNAFTRLVILQKNSGQSTALRVGIEQSRYDTLVILDGDMQNNPADIIPMVSLLTANKFSLIQGFRKKRQDSLDKLLPSIVANLFIRFLFKLPIHDIGCSLKVFTKDSVSSFVYFDGFHRYIPLLIYLKKFPISEMVVTHRKRNSGKSKYGLRRTFKVLKHLWLFKFDKIQSLP